MIPGLQFAALVVAVLLGVTGLGALAVRALLGPADRPSRPDAASTRRTLEFALGAAAKIRSLTDAELLEWETVRINSVYAVMGEGQDILAGRWATVLTDQARIDAERALIGDARERLSRTAAQLARRG